ncbi:MAG: hypothetical protein C4534_03210 [Gaiellales bacterium]|nr:MAG: hypothetical protein C4534_03210 [Gaiellales bacterium]
MITDKLPEPGSAMYHFGQRGAQPSGNETIVRVWPKGGNPWFGVFPHGQSGHAETTGLHIWPSTSKLFVVARGSGFLVDTSNPNNWSAAQLSPITCFHSEAIDGLFLISDNLRVAAYSSRKLLWKSAQISWNGIRNLRVNSEGVMGEAWDDLWEAWVSFLIDPETGRHQGGATFSFDQS